MPLLFHKIKKKTTHNNLSFLDSQFIRIAAMHKAFHAKEYIHRFDSSLSIELKNQILNSPFNYTPDPISLLAVKHLQEYLEKQTIWNHDFGITQSNAESMGKMFGVLVIIDEDNNPGFLVSFSGKLAGKVLLDSFVPPIYNMLEEDGFYREGERELNHLNQKIEELIADLQNSGIEQHYEELVSQANYEIEKARDEFKGLKSLRNLQRENLKKSLSLIEKEKQLENLNNQSRDAHRIYKQKTAFWRQQIENYQIEHLKAFDKLNKLKQMRKFKSAELQDKLFSQYDFVNSKLETKSLIELFPNDEKPPSGAGDCAAPKLFQFAFKHNLKPVRIAEFWWGKSPSTEVRKHKAFYPACKGKCEPILKHMLSGIELSQAEVLSLKRPKVPNLQVIYEDETIIVINKPENLLSVPGKIRAESVYSKISETYPDIQGPLLVHRLDMATSGILLIAKSMDIYKTLQQEFINRKVKKSYIAILDGIVQKESGEINLPLRVNHYDRPRQLVDFELGKQAITRWKVIEYKDSSTRVNFIPVTGRTHQLRVHAAHQLGLNTPIKGDDIYGTGSTRLHLHAEKLEISHPVTGKKHVFFSECPF